jgi:hypothetical protein
MSIVDIADVGVELLIIRVSSAAANWTGVSSASMLWFWK